jgi:DNA-binding beta-propeller fold protein YncE
MLYGSGKYSYELVEGWAKCPEEFTFNDVCGLAVDIRDRVYILNRGAHPVIVFDENGKILTSWGEAHFKRAHGSGISGDGSIFCTDDYNHTVSKFTPEGKLLMVMGTRDKPSDTGYIMTGDITTALATIKGGPPFNRPTGVAITPSGEIYISDGYGNARVHKFSADGKLVFSWGEPGTGPGQFRLPHSVRIDKRNRIWVADRENNRVQIFDAKGKFLDQWTELLRPTDVCFDIEGNVFISELGARVSIFTSDHKLLARWGSPGLDRQNELFAAPHTIALDSKGNIYVGEVAKTFAKVDKGTRSVQKFVWKHS